MSRLAPPVLLLLLATAALAAAPSAQAQSKRAEGRYFVELAEIMLSTEDFDVAFAEDDHLGPRRGDPAVPVVAETPRGHLETPMVTIGLNRPSGKSAFSMTFHDFDMGDQRVPSAFDREGYVTTSNLLPPGVAFQRQAQPSSARPGSRDDDFIPNWGTDWAFQLKVDHQMTDFTYERNVYENERFRLRWQGGLRYGRLKQTFGHAMAFAPEQGLTGSDTIQTVERQDFFFVTSNIDTRGLGPKFGLDARWLLDGAKKWSVEAAADFAVLPESTNVAYRINLADASSEAPSALIVQVGSEFVPIGIDQEQPAIPGISEGLRDQLPPFAAAVNQSGFTENVILATGRVGFRYQANDYFGIGLDLWQMRYLNVLSNTGVLSTVNREGTFEFIDRVLGPAAPGEPPRASLDPQLQSPNSIVRVPRFDEREDFVFDGLNLNLSFQF